MVRHLVMVTVQGGMRWIVVVGLPVLDSEVVDVMVVSVDLDKIGMPKLKSTEVGVIVVVVGDGDEDVENCHSIVTNKI